MSRYDEDEEPQVPAGANPAEPADLCEEEPAAPRATGLDDFRNARLLKSLNRTVQIILVVTLFAMLNYLAATAFLRYDLTRNNRYSLSPETRAELAGLDETLRVIVLKPPPDAQERNQKILGDIRNLLREYEYAGTVAGEQRLILEEVDIYRQRARAEEIAGRYNVADASSLIISTEDGERFREIPFIELYTMEGGEATAFKGEQVISSAINDVAGSEQQVIYFTTGHAELSLRQTDPLKGMSQAAQFLRQRNFELKELDLTRAPEVPEDAGLVVIPGPRTALQPFEAAKLRRFLGDRNGRLLVLLQPRQRHGLGDLLLDWGILADDRVIIDVAEGASVAGGDNMIVRQFARHPITQILLDNGLAIVGGEFRPVRIDPGRPFDGRLALEPLMASSEVSWADLAYTEPGANFDPRVDVPGPVQLAVIAQRSAASQLDINIPGGRLVVFGNADFAANTHFPNFGNHILFLNTINWMLERDSLLNIAPRPIETFQLTLSEKSLAQLSLRMLAIPGAAGLFGLLLCLWRHRM